MSEKIISGAWNKVKGNISEGLKLTEMMNALNCLSTAEIVVGGEAYQKGLLELMAQHYEFYGQLEDEDYVTSGSVLSCSKSKYPEKDILTLPVDHGVMAPNGRPLATCSDCRAGEHIGNFGICKCEPTGYLKVLMIKNQPEGFDYSNGYKCVPLLRHGWILKGKSGIVVVEDEVREDLEEALLSSSALICQYGGVISIEEVPDNNADKETKEYIKNILMKLDWFGDDDEIEEIKNIFDDFGIIDKISIACFLVICRGESGPKEKFVDINYCNQGKYLDKFGRPVSEKKDGDGGGYTYEERGVGYLQVTFQNDQLECLKYLQKAGYYDGNIVETEPGYVDILRKMPWQASAWRWAIYEQIPKSDETKNLNDYIVARAVDNGNRLTLGMVLTAECFINGKVKETNIAVKDPGEVNRKSDYVSINDALSEIARGLIFQAEKKDGDIIINTNDNANASSQNTYYWYTDNSYLYAGGWRFDAPKNWKNFEKVYYTLYPEERITNNK